MCRYLLYNLLNLKHRLAGCLLINIQNVIETLAISEEYVAVTDMAMKSDTPQKHLASMSIHTLEANMQRKHITIFGKQIIISVVCLPTLFASNPVNDIAEKKIGIESR